MFQLQVVEKLGAGIKMGKQKTEMVMMLMDGDGSPSTMSNDVDERKRKRKQAEIRTVQIDQPRRLWERTCYFLVSQP